jgi:hypothetical protein
MFKVMMFINISTFLLISLVECAQHNKIKMEEQMSSNEAQILEVSRQLTQSMIEKDTASMSKILDANFTLTHITGYVQPKNEWFAEIKKESMKYYSAEEIDYSVKINGNNAEFINRNLLDARIWGTRNTWRLQQKMQLEKCEGKWIILNSVASTF